jgi:hypothetical protein
MSNIAQIMVLKHFPVAANQQAYKAGTRPKQTDDGMTAQTGAHFGQEADGPEDATSRLSDTFLLAQHTKRCGLTAPASAAPALCHRLQLCGGIGDQQRQAAGTRIQNSFQTVAACGITSTQVSLSPDRLIAGDWRADTGLWQAQTSISWWT